MQNITNHEEINTLYTEICSCHARAADTHNKRNDSSRRTVVKTDPLTGKVFVYDGKKVMTN